VLSYSSLIKFSLRGVTSSFKILEIVSRIHGLVIETGILESLVKDDWKGIFLPTNVLHNTEESFLTGVSHEDKAIADVSKFSIAELWHL